MGTDKVCGLKLKFRLKNKSPRKFASGDSHYMVKNVSLKK